MGIVIFLLIVFIAGVVFYVNDSIKHKQLIDETYEKQKIEEELIIKHALNEINTKK